MEETTARFSDLTDDQQLIVCEAHAKPLHTTAKKLLPIFRLGNPLIATGARADGSVYCRVHTDSAAVMKVLLKQYL